MHSQTLLRRCFIVLMFLAIVWNSTMVRALNTSSHVVINEAVVQQNSAFETILRRSLGFSNGRLTTLRFNGEPLRIQEWVGRGGEHEDDLLRFLRHFHDPLKPWDAAGLDFVVDRHDSSVRWMQEPNQGNLDTGGFWSWGDARRLYYQALVEPNANYREALWANLFRALGQIMHLVVDASVPEHTRNDMHPLGGLTPTSSYE